MGRQVNMSTCSFYIVTGCVFSDTGIVGLVQFSSSKVGSPLSSHSHEAALCYAELTQRAASRVSYTKPSDVRKITRRKLELETRLENRCLERRFQRYLL